MAKSTDWGEFLRIAGGVFLLGIGVTTVGGSAGKLWLLVLGFALIAGGIAIIASKK